MILNKDEQESYFFGSGGIFEHASAAYPTAHPEAPRYRQMLQKAGIANIHKLALGCLVVAIALLLSGSALYNTALQTSAEGSEAFLAHVGSDFPAKGTELLIYELGNYPPETITTIEFTDGTRRYFYTGDDDLLDQNEPSMPSDDPQVMAADK